MALSTKPNVNLIVHLKPGARDVADKVAKSSNDYARGQRDGVRLALSILAAEEAKWESLLGESRSWRTNATREVRHKTLRVAQQRVQTALNRLKPKDDTDQNAELAGLLDKIGL